MYKRIYSIYYIVQYIYDVYINIYLLIFRRGILIQKIIYLSKDNLPNFHCNLKPSFNVSNP